MENCLYPVNAARRCDGHYLAYDRNRSVVQHRNDHHGCCDHPGYRGYAVTQVAIWFIGALAAVAAWALTKYLYPWFLTVVVPWLKTHNLVALAEMAVKYAESELGRYAGEEKWKLAVALMKAKGFDINCEEVTAALKAAWETLDLQQITAGVKKSKK